MLTHLHLRDFVIIEEAALDFASGLTALTGETGAGKSIVVDALLMIAGKRASGDIVRQGAERAEIAASFSWLPAPATAWLAAQAIECDGELIVRRVVGRDGRSRAFVNGQMVPLQALRELADLTIEIHGQSEFQHLVKRGAQRELLDEHLGEPALPAAVAAAFISEFDALRAAASSRDARLDLLRYQVAELAAEVCGVAEIDALFVERKRIAGRGRLAEAARTALDAAYEADGHSAHDLLARAQAALRGPAETDPALAQPAALLAEAAIGAREAAEMLRRYLEALDVDPVRQEEIERHTAALEELARKHRVLPAGLPAELTRLRSELEGLGAAEQNLADLERQLAVLAADYRTAAGRLTGLGMSGGRFEVAVAPADAGNAESAHGADEIEFLVAANPGQPPKSLAKVASGGELSRISLAVQVAAAARTGAPCMVFDEVDAGIGGAVAEIVGRQLRALGERGQVLCVTHLPQVASLAHAQFRVTKLTDGKVTRTAVQLLAYAERIDEIARMSGGIDITDSARAHARDMLERAGAPEPARRVRRVRR